MSTPEEDALKEFFKQYTINYKNLSQLEKDALDFTKSPCNIWGYIEELILTIKDLEARIKVLEDAKEG